MGRALSIKKVHDKAGSVEGTGGRVRYDAGDCEISVEWFERDVCGGEERRIFRRREGSNVYSFNSTELRLIENPGAGSAAIQLEMSLLPPVGGVPLETVQRVASRSSFRLMHVPRPNYVPNVRFHAHEQRADPPDQLWQISAGSETAILDNCW